MALSQRLTRSPSPNTTYSRMEGSRRESYKPISIKGRVPSLPTVDSRALAKIHYEEMAAYLMNHLVKEPANARSSAREKLTRLTTQQFQELSTDVYDELIRRKNHSENGEVTFLPVVDDFHPKRNQARQKLATLPKNRFKDLSSDVFHELERRFPEFKEPDVKPSQDTANNSFRVQSTLNLTASPLRSEEADGELGRDVGKKTNVTASTTDDATVSAENAQVDPIVPNKSTVADEDTYGTERQGGDKQERENNAPQIMGMQSLTRDSHEVARIHYEEIAAYLLSILAKEPVNARSSEREKLTRLATQKLQGLTTDVYDELNRRKNNSDNFPFLPARDEFLPKRNQSRQKLSTLPKTRFEDLCSDVLHELGRRYPEFKELDSIGRSTSPTSAYGDVDEFLFDFYQSPPQPSEYTPPPIASVTTPLVHSATIMIPTSDVSRVEQQIDAELLTGTLLISDTLVNDGHQNSLHEELQSETEVALLPGVVSAHDQNKRSSSKTTHSAISSLISFRPYPENTILLDNSTIPQANDTKGMIEEFCKPYSTEIRDYCSTIGSSLKVYGALVVYVYVNILFDDVGQRRVGSFCDALEQWKVWDDVECLSQHHVIRRTLWKLTEEGDSGVRFIGVDIANIIQFDMKTMQRLLERILNDRGERRRFLSLSLMEPKPVINLLQTDGPNALKRSLGRAIAGLARKSGCYPDCLILDCVEKCGDSAVAGGGFADIWKGKMGNIAVALKALRIYRNTLQEKALKGFCHEAVIWRQLKHRNILPFLGVFKGNKHLERLCLVSPWMSAGNIMDFLDSHPDSDRITLLADIAEGLKYLHEFTPAVVHGDLKGANIFITPDLTACLADFGLARFRDSIESTMGSATGNVTGTLRWQAPELLHSTDGDEALHANRESDLYSFGCVCIEVMTNEPPFSEIMRDGAVVLAVASKRKPRRPTGDCVKRGLDDSLWELMMHCWDGDPAIRPSAADIVNYFNDRKGEDSRITQPAYEYPYTLQASLGQYGFSDDDILSETRRDEKTNVGVIPN